MAGEGQTATAGAGQRQPGAGADPNDPNPTQGGAAQDPNNPQGGQPSGDPQGGEQDPTGGEGDQQGDGDLEQVQQFLQDAQPEDLVGIPAIERYADQRVTSAVQRVEKRLNKQHERERQKLERRLEQLERVANPGEGQGQGQQDPNQQGAGQQAQRAQPDPQLREQYDSLEASYQDLEHFVEEQFDNAVEQLDPQLREQFADQLEDDDYPIQKRWALAMKLAAQTQQRGPGNFGRQTRPGRTSGRGGEGAGGEGDTGGAGGEQHPAGRAGQTQPGELGRKLAQEAAQRGQPDGGGYNPWANQQ